ncbi:receptor-like serine/threonine-protein kinase SD1-8 isoform X2 [Juglans microcarpa x Juglans regia]|uniref:receptor-like serine/threonine-protein kinase SD1-8 isoform X2 n=1 Tax=Juglans microcarpa x Juglans regia TaxID=2249226 RepID=UPI001B7F10D0|nr:receptor-like serine/threonine-protein kinase SD1-8 isoform X2 [Juglans microcarpa x Juglans regia]
MFFEKSYSDTISVGQSLKVGESRLSKGGKFEIGFFTGLPSKIFLGSCHKNFDVKDIVWVANRENPLSDPSSLSLEFSEDRNLVLLESSSKTPFWSTNLTDTLPNSTEAVLLDDGNFVVRDGSNPSTIFWKSFDHPTNVWLPGAKLGIDKITGKAKQFVSWKSLKDPAPGLFSFGLDPSGSSQLILQWNRSQVYWSTGVWNEKSFSLAPDMVMNDINFSFVSDENESYFTYSVGNNYSRYMFVLEPSGQIQLLMTWSDSPWNWTVTWSRPESPSEVYALCGKFGVYQENFSNPCACLKGFEGFPIEDRAQDDWSGGCVRKSPLQCENGTHANGKKDWFLKVPNVRLPINPKAYPAANAKRCEFACMNDCSCPAYAHNSSGCMIWEGGLLNLQQLSDGREAGQDIYLRLAADELQSTKRNRWKVWLVAVLVPATGIISLCLCIYFSRQGKRKAQGEVQEKATSNDLLLFHFNTELSGMKDVELPLFSYESVSAATNNFSTENKLGRGGFGPVYKGKLLNGEEIAVKMLSKRSGQGLEEFRNEATLIAKLQHTNLVRLLGCCVEQDEKILIYEYMPNKSLDSYLFDADPIKKKMLDWGIRMRIIEGIAQGLLYLHQYSRLRIIHRDLKPSNILLDGEMNSKISDFGMARIVGDNATQADTNRIVGTYGYMSPEYAMEGRYSIKSDVFSFGVLLLEILSGKKNKGFNSSESFGLLIYAWELWREYRSLELMDLTIGYPSSTSMMLKFINIGLLCVQEKPADRPTMSDVVSMISNEHTPLPVPKQPAFTIGGNSMDTNSTTSSAEDCSVNDVTVSIMEAR